MKNQKKGVHPNPGAKPKQDSFLKQLAKKKPLGLVGLIILLAFLPTLIIQIVKVITDRQHGSVVTGKATLSDD